MRRFDVAAFAAVLLRQRTRPQRGIAGQAGDPEAASELAQPRLIVTASSGSGEEDRRALIGVEHYLNPVLHARAVKVV